MELCDSTSISLAVISSIPRNVVDDADAEVGGGGGGGVVGAAVAVAAGVAVVRVGLAALSAADGGGVGDR